MSLILNIDTALETAIVTIAENGTVLYEEVNAKQKDHAAFLQPAIQILVTKANVGLDELAAVAVNHGPGSYTGTRVGMSSAKGLCYALNKPLITVNALEILAKDAIDYNDVISNTETLYCPMIDARRMEVYTAVYDRNLNVILSPTAVDLNNSGPVNLLLKKNVVFFGSGATKLSRLSVYGNAQFLPIQNPGSAMSRLSFNKLQRMEFADVVYAEPLYIKEFYTVNNV